MDAFLARSWPRDITGNDVAICELIYFYVHQEELEQTGPLLSRVLAVTTRLIFGIDSPPRSLAEFTKLLGGSLRGVEHDDPALVQSLLDQYTQSIKSVTSFSGLHGFFTRVERLLLREEMFDDIQNMTIKPAARQIDEHSPFGQYLHLCLESYLCLEDDEFVKLVERVASWARGDDTPEQTWTAEEEIQIALRKGDYSTARANLEGSFDRAPAAILGQTLPETLLNNARFHVQTRAYEMAKASLEEALRLARGINDTVCIAACDDLHRQIEFEQQSAEKRSVLSRNNVKSDFANGVESVKLTSKIDALRCLDEGHSILAVSQGTEELLSRFRKKAAYLDSSLLGEGSSPRELEVILSSIWDSMGSTINGDVIRESNADRFCTTNGWSTREHRTGLALIRAQSLSLRNLHVEAFEVLLDATLLCTLDIYSLQQWHGEVLRCLFRAAQAAGADKLMRALTDLRPDLRREFGGGGIANDNDGSERQQMQEAGMSWDAEAKLDPSHRAGRATIQEAFLQRLNEAREFRVRAGNGMRSLQLAVEVMDEAQDKRMFATYRLATLEAVEALLEIGQATRAQVALDSVAAALLSGHDRSLSGRAAWLYMRAILNSVGKEETSREDSAERYQKALDWAERAIRDFSNANMWPELKQSVYYKARICHHLDLTSMRDEAATAHKTISKEVNDMQQKQTQFLERIQEVARLASARVVAGG